MSIFSGHLVEIEGVKYHYTSRMHKKIIKLAGTFYAMHGYTHEDDFQYHESSHPQERLMYSMALQGFIQAGKIKALNNG